MASTLIFDQSDEGVKAMVDGWADSTEYTATVTVKTGAGPQRNVSEVTSFTPDEETAVEETDFKSKSSPGTTAATASEKKSAAKIPAMEY